MKYLSRKLFITILFGLIAPIIFKILGVSDSVTLAAIALGASYHGSNVLESKWTK